MRMYTGGLYVYEAPRALGGLPALMNRSERRSNACERYTDERLRVLVYCTYPDNSLVFVRLSIR